MISEDILKDLSKIEVVISRERIAWKGSWLSFEFKNNQKLKQFSS